MSYKTAYLLLHFAVLLFGFTAILGVLIDMRALDIVWWRVLITALSLIFFLRGAKSLLKMPRRYLLTYLGIGAIVGLHWLTFYGAVKLSNASITLVCMATASFFTALIEPLVTRSRWNFLDLSVGVLIVPGMMLVVDDLSGEENWGVIVGLTSAALAALFASFNKKYIEKGHPYTITFLEMSGAWIFLSMVLPFVPSPQGAIIQWPPADDWVFLLTLALLCTTLAFILTLKALEHISAFASNLVINMEPVYGILLSIFILQEHKDLTPTFYYGVVIITTVVFLYPVVKRKLEKKMASDHDVPYH
jgi:drug/metabolite transporter (DMT)-like permease